MLSISDQHLSAHEREQLQRRDALALQWYRQQGSRLPQLPTDDLRAVLEKAKESAKEVGLLDDEDDRLRRLMAFHAIIPEYNGDQWLLGMDAVFDLPSNSAAIEAFDELAGDAA
ncbi:MAG: hypothetical protein AAF250_12150 [Pseudomonadota bacterium]